MNLVLQPTKVTVSWWRDVKKGCKWVLSYGDKGQIHRCWGNFMFICMEELWPRGRMWSKLMCKYGSYTFTLLFTTSSHISLLKFRCCQLVVQSINILKKLHTNPFHFYLIMALFPHKLVTWQLICISEKTLWSQTHRTFHISLVTLPSLYSSHFTDKKRTWGSETCFGPRGW